MTAGDKYALQITNSQRYIDSLQNLKYDFFFLYF